jgi:hypothetical protein
MALRPNVKERILITVINHTTCGDLNLSAAPLECIPGISPTDVMYKAQMVGTWSLLLRNARRHK